MFRENPSLGSLWPIPAAAFDSYHSSDLLEYGQLSPNSAREQIDAAFGIVDKVTFDARIRLGNLVAVPYFRKPEVSQRLPSIPLLQKPELVVKYGVSSSAVGMCVHPAKPAREIDAKKDPRVRIEVCCSSAASLAAIAEA